MDSNVRETQQDFLAKPKGARKRIGNITINNVKD
jgi:hypothetical protein